MEKISALEMYHIHNEGRPNMPEKKDQEPIYDKK